MAKFLCKGAALMLKTVGATPAWQAVGQVEEIGAIGITSDEVEVTTLDATDFREYLQGYKDSGESALNIIYDAGFADHDDSENGLFGIFSSGDTRDWAVKMQSSAAGGFSYILFKGFLRDWEFGAWNPDDPQTAAPVLRISGAVTISETAPTVEADAPATEAMPVAA
jgi:hypothetical protein